MCVWRGSRPRLLAYGGFDLGQPCLRQRFLPRLFGADCVHLGGLVIESQEAIDVLQERIGHGADAACGAAEFARQFVAEPTDPAADKGTGWRIVDLGWKPMCEKIKNTSSFLIFAPRFVEIERGGGAEVGPASLVLLSRAAVEPEGGILCREGVGIDGFR